MKRVMRQYVCDYCGASVSLDEFEVEEMGMNCPECERFDGLRTPPDQGVRIYEEDA